MSAESSALFPGESKALAVIMVPVVTIMQAECTLCGWIGNEYTDEHEHEARRESFQHFDTEHWEP